MASEIYFDDSHGGQEKLPSLEWLKDKVFNADDAFWVGSMGMCSLSYLVDGSFKSGIDLIGREDFGFMIDHNYLNELVESLRFGERTGEVVEAYKGGNPNLYFKEYFVPKEIAWQAIEYFLETGERDPSLTWESAELVESA